MSPTIYDVSRLSGVSTATVSRAFSEPEHVREVTRRKVYEAAEALRYSPNAIARAMARQRTDNVAYLICKKDATILDGFYSRICEGILSRFNNTDLRLLISTAEDWRGSGGDARNKQIEGAILAGDAPVEIVMELQRKNVKVVLVNNDITGFDVPAVVSDERRGVDLAVGYLAEKGHSKIAMLAGRFAPYISAERYEGFLEAMERRGLPMGQGCMQMCAPDDVETATALAMRLLGRADRPTAVFGANDVIAAGALKAAARLGLRVPEDVAVVGMDDSMICPLLEPELTSVHICCHQMGARSAELLLALLEGRGDVPRRTVVPVELAVRRSC